MLEHLNMTDLLFLDIETVPQAASFDGLEPEMRSLWEQKAARLKQGEETPEALYERAGIYAEFGKIVCISVGVFTGKKGDGLRIKSFFGHDEPLLLRDFSALLEKMPRHLVLCAHNGKEFDFPYLCRRLLINRLPLPSQLNISGKKPWEINHLDTLELWKFGDFKNFTSLSLLAAVLGIPTPKDDIDGSQVGPVYWREGDLERIRVYCQKDVVTVARILLRLKGMPLIADENILFV